MLIKKFLTAALNLLLIAAMLLANIVLFAANVSAASVNGAKYFKNNDCFAVYPAEKWSGSQSQTIHAGNWAVNAQDGGSLLRQDIHIWENGSDSKFRVVSLNSSSNTFKIQVAKNSASDGGLVWDVEGGNKKSGSIIHVWSRKDDGDDDTSQYFYLVDDNDGDPETFYIKNLNSEKYLVPRNYYKDPDDDNNEKEKKENWKVV